MDTQDYCVPIKYKSLIINEMKFILYKIIVWFDVIFIQQRHIHKYGNFYIDVYNKFYSIHIHLYR